MGLRDASEKEAASPLAPVAVLCCMDYVSVEAEHSETPLSAARASLLGEPRLKPLQQLSEASVLPFQQHLSLSEHCVLSASSGCTDN